MAYSTFAPESVTAFACCGTSFLTNAENSAIELRRKTRPSWPSVSRISGDSRTRFIWALRWPAIPAGTAPGNYFLLAKTDADGLVGESSETNNVGARTIKVNAAP